ncbi:hypothetical protein KAU11_06660 [Candidatus Babeliales bacterium]|nr:hypothetical protein [Candidatus Babeliales bacterium]
MGQLTQEEINADFFDEVKRLKNALSAQKIINDEISEYAEKLESALENCGVDIDEIIGEK